MSSSSYLKIAIIGAGAAGLFCAGQAAKKGHDVHVFDHAKTPAEKIRISGGGRCNFTNLYCSHKNFTSQNPHFCKSPLARYPASSFISMVSSYQISYHEKNPEKKTGQLFCDTTAQHIIDMLIAECKKNLVQIHLQTTVDAIENSDGKWIVEIEGKKEGFDKVVIASGGLSIPKIGASDFGYKIARQAGHKIIPTYPALVPLTFTDQMQNFTKMLSGVALDSILIRSKTNQFRDDLLFTHRGLSGPAILQISTYWQAGEPLLLNLLPDKDIFALLKQTKTAQPTIKLHKFLAQYLPSRFVEAHLEMALSDVWIKDKNIADYKESQLQQVAQAIHNWEVHPNGTEGYRTAEVTGGGVCVDEIDNKTFESKLAKGLYFIGEVLDVTGHLGGHNFQWAWASGFCCGSEI